MDTITALTENRNVFKGLMLGLQADDSDTVHECVTSYETFMAMQDAQTTFADAYKDTIENGMTDYGVYLKEFKRLYEIYQIQAYEVMK